MVKFVCAECGYRFESEEKKLMRCPYCSGERVENEKSAEELVDNIKISEDK